MLRIVAVRGPKAPQPRRGVVHGVRVRRNAPVIVTPTPHGGTHRCRPTFPDGLPTWFVGRDLCVPPPECAGHRHPHTARRHTQVPPYIPRRTADMVRRAGPMCPAAGMHRKPHNRLARSDRVGRGLAPAAGIHHRFSTGPRPKRRGLLSFFLSFCYCFLFLFIYYY